MLTLSSIHVSILLEIEVKHFTFLKNTNNKNNKKGAIYMFKMNGFVASVYGEMVYDGYYDNNDFDTYTEYFNNNYDQYADMRDYKEYTNEHED